jgi:hypothetical protein
VLDSDTGVWYREGGGVTKGGIMTMDDNFWVHDDFLWLTLASEGRFELIERLQKALNGVPGFGTIVVPLEGFSDIDKTHNMVLRCLRWHGVHLFDVAFEVGNLELALHGSCQEV